MRELGSCLVDDHIQFVLDRERSLIVQMKANPDHAGMEEAYLLFDFETKQLQANLYGLDAKEHCDGDCYRNLETKAAHLR